MERKMNKTFLLLLLFSCFSAAENDSIHFSCAGMLGDPDLEMSVILSSDKVTANVITPSKIMKTLKLVSGKNAFASEGETTAYKGTKGEVVYYEYNSLIIETIKPPKMYVRYNNAIFNKEKTVLILGSSVNYSCESN